MKLADDKIARIHASIPLPNQDKIVLIEEPTQTTAGEAWSAHDANHNIYRVTDDYQIVWQIKPSTAPAHDDDSFMDITLVNENGTAYVETGRWTGYNFKLDIATGHAEIFAWRK